MSYPERLAMIDLEPLELRRLRTDLNEYYKCFHNLNSINYTEHFNFYVPPAASRSSSPKLVKPVKANNTVMCSFFIEQLIAGTHCLMIHGIANLCLYLNVFLAVLTCLIL